jgi:hypothetical protein
MTICGVLDRRNDAVDKGCLIGRAAAGRRWLVGDWAAAGRVLAAVAGGGLHQMGRRKRERSIS